jgi:pSer/pThr/pTyr-binding forkhead associated (FHA) protein
MNHKQTELAANDPVFQLKPAAPRYARIVVRRGVNNGEYITLNHGVNIMGRISGIQLYDEMVSRRHARIYCQDGEFYIEDLHSTNGTFVNGEQIYFPAQLKHGDTVRIGLTLLEFETMNGFQSSNWSHEDGERSDSRSLDAPTVHAYIYDSRVFAS